MHLDECSARALVASGQSLDLFVGGGTWLLPTLEALSTPAPPRDISLLSLRNMRLFKK